MQEARERSAEQARREGWLELAGTRLHFVEWQPAAGPRQPALFLLHGLSSNALVWQRLAAQLPHRRLVALDQRSHGRSERPPEGYARSHLVEEAAAAIAELGLDRPLLAGHSWGASVALELAATRPDVCSGLAFVDGPPAAMSRMMSREEAAKRTQPPMPVFIDLEQAVAAQRGYLEGAWDEDLRSFVEAGLVENEGGLTSTLTVAVRRQILEDLYDFDPPAFFPAVGGPVLVAMAANLWPGAPEEFAQRRREAVEAILASRPDAQVRWYDSRHDIPLIRPAELAADIEKTAIAAAFASLARQAAALSGDWSRRAHGDGEGWDARDLLAHLASTQSTLPAVVASALRPPPADGALRQPFDANRWNASQVTRRAEHSPTRLAAEMAAGASALHAALMGVDLAQPVTIGSYAGEPVARAMEAMLGHQRAHFEELSRALS